jgi:hypothetical protein
MGYLGKKMKKLGGGLLLGLRRGIGGWGSEETCWRRPVVVLRRTPVRCGGFGGRISCFLHSLGRGENKREELQVGGGREGCAWLREGCS